MNSRITSGIIIGLTLLSGTAAAELVNKGALIVRDGAANSDANYNGENSAVNGQLFDVSALCSAKTTDRTRDNALALTGTDHTRTWGTTFGTAQVSTILNLGGQVETDPKDRNPNHCKIRGLTLGQLKGVWKMCAPGARGC